MCYLEEVDGLVEELDRRGFIELVLPQQVDEVVEGLLVGGHLWEQGPHFEEQVHTARLQRTAGMDGNT